MFVNDSKDLLSIIACNTLYVFYVYKLISFRNMFLLIRMNILEKRLSLKRCKPMCFFLLFFKHMSYILILGKYIKVTIFLWSLDSTRLKAHCLIQRIMFKIISIFFQTLSPTEVWLRLIFIHLISSVYSPNTMYPVTPFWH